jgi:hypothetical protein
MPILICVVILTFIAVFSVQTISIKRQMRNFSIYYICGLKWRECAIINLIGSLISILISIFITTLGIYFANYLNLLKNTVINLGFWQIIICLCIGILIAIFSMIMPILLINNSSAKEVLRRN